LADLAVAVLGVGIHGSRYAEHLLRGDVPGARLAGVSRRSPEAAAAWTARGVRFETDALLLAADPSVDAVVVASSPAAHAAHAVAALRARKPVLIEKPVAPDMRGGALIMGEARRARVPVLVGHSLRYNPVCAAWRDAVASGGVPRHLTLSMRHERVEQPWQGDPREGGALLGCATHMADLARWATGDEIEGVLACQVHAAPGRAETAAAALARMHSGATLLVDVSQEAPSRRGGLDAWGDGGQVEGDYYAHELHRREGRARVPVPLPPPGPGLVPLLRDFVAAARGGPSGVAATLQDGLAALAFVEGCRAAL